MYYIISCIIFDWLWNTTKNIGIKRNWKKCDLITRNIIDLKYYIFVIINSEHIKKKTSTNFCQHIKPN